MTASSDYVTVYADDGSEQRHSRAAIAAAYSGNYARDYVALHHPAAPQGQAEGLFHSMYEHIYPEQRRRAFGLPSWIMWAELDGGALPFHRPYVADLDFDPD